VVDADIESFFDRLGGPLPPVLANVVLHRLDRAWQQRHRRLGALIRYADDVCVCCPTRDRAEAAMAVLTEILGGLGLNLARDKTHIITRQAIAAACREQLDGAQTGSPQH
jgi:retron-type reverse transcriptase